MVLHHGMVDTPSNANIADPGPQPESWEFEDGRKCGTGGADGGWVCFPLCPLGHADLLHRVERISEPPQEDLRVRFYEHYHEGIEEYNRKPVRGYFKDLGAMLISVSPACHYSDLSVLTWRTGTPSSSPHTWMASFSFLQYRQNVRLPSPHFHDTG